VTGAIAEKIARRIRAEGPLTIAAFMAIALHDPDGGYYVTRGPIGAAGDFTTAPEISQIFGELIGAWCGEMWHRMGRPDPVIVVELGPGRGTLMNDLLRAVQTVPEFLRALQLHLLEVSPIFRAEQEQRLGQFRPTWLTRIEDLPNGPLLLIANEFLDALPVRQFVRGRAHWAERMVVLDGEGGLALADGRESPAATPLVPAALRCSAPGTVAEICPSALALAGTIGARLARQQGAALFIDYGHFPSAPGATLRAVSSHRPVSPFVAPGMADLSAAVDFAAFSEAARGGGAKPHGPVSQGQFLVALGAGQRLAALSARATASQRQALASGVRRLLDPGEMGEIFKVIAVVSRGLLPVGFGQQGEEMCRTPATKP
jgi:NADH dehydrogenase [ubiquinone] 1 alpha subcomplex assembly factor 7